VGIGGAVNIGGFTTISGNPGAGEAQLTINNGVSAFTIAVGSTGSAHINQVGTNKSIIIDAAGGMIMNSISGGLKFGAVAGDWKIQQSGLTTLELSSTIPASRWVTINSTVESSSTSTGSLVLSGGLGLAKNAYIGGGISVGAGAGITGDLNITGNFTQAAVTEDLQVTAHLKGSGGNMPSYTAVNGSTYVRAYAFPSNAMKEIFFEAQIPHSWSLGTDIKPHLHWVADQISGNIEWKIEYQIHNIDSTWGTALTEYTTDTQTVPADANNDPNGPLPYTHYITYFATRTMGLITPSALIHGRIWRDGGQGGDTMAGPAYMMAFDIHYKRNKLGKDL
jgi:hypothetical protein